MVRLYCLECDTVRGEYPQAPQGDRESSFAVCQSCEQHGGRPGTTIIRGLWAGLTGTRLAPDAGAAV